MQSNFDVQVSQAASPAYPEWALDQGVEAVVDVMITLDDKGKVSDIKILRERISTSRYRRPIPTKIQTLGGTGPRGAVQFQKTIPVPIGRLTAQDAGPPGGNDWPDANG